MLTFTFPATLNFKLLNCLFFHDVTARLVSACLPNYTASDFYPAGGPAKCFERTPL